jgi:Fe-S-cluster containining protein
MAGCLCDRCAALCCRYFALPIDNPDCRRDFDNIRWYLVHENVVVFVEKKQWYIGIMNRCKHLQSDNRCEIYETRPQLCRSYSTDNCDYHGGDYNYEHLFTSADDLWTFALDFLAKQRQTKQKRKSRRRTRALVKLNGSSLPSLSRMNGHGNGHSNGHGKTNGNGRTLSLPLLRV